ncbi:ankyrin repeat domain-containing protein [Hydrogenophaga sp.]|uniref:ankyrin repeat domain-containing protein n=1 Tax=Hydrogenophaga sp. TaxID=1904254 RepID=UPI002716A7F7|nr:ankyrin repeat domain-containing protein [Hydrogenophaga sp.]MDO9438574.1 ankyrin repeat domain-containing protein [Hydrogenophaga sp.]
MAPKPTAAPSTWMILGHDQADVDFSEVTSVGASVGAGMKAYGDGRQELTWEGLKALPVQAGDALALLCHAYLDKVTGRVMVELGPKEAVPLVDLVVLMFGKGVLNFLLLGCEVSSVMDALQNRFELDPGIPRAGPGGLDGLCITSVGSGGLTLKLANKGALILWLLDRATLRTTGQAGDLLHRRCVEEMHVLSGDGQELERETRPRLRIDAVSDDLKPGLLFMHANGGDLEEVRALIQRHQLSPNLQDASGLSVLILASNGGHKEVVGFLLEQPGIQLELADAVHGATALWMACRNGHVRVAQLLLDRGAQIDIAHEASGQTALYTACLNGHVETVRFLLTKHPKLDQRDIQGATALHGACFGQHIEIVRMLLGAGADRGALTANGETPMSIALKTGNQELIALF